MSAWLMSLSGVLLVCIAAAALVLQGLPLLDIDPSVFLDWDIPRFVPPVLGITGLALYSLGKRQLDA